MLSYICRENFTDLYKLNLVLWFPLLATASAVSKNDVHFKNGQKQLKNYHFASEVWICGTLIINFLMKYNLTMICMQVQNFWPAHDSVAFLHSLTFTRILFTSKKDDFHKKYFKKRQKAICFGLREEIQIMYINFLIFNLVCQNKASHQLSWELFKNMVFPNYWTILRFSQIFCCMWLYATVHDPNDGQ